MFNDQIAEKSILAGIMRYNYQAYADVVPFINEHYFNDEAHQLVFKGIKKIFDSSDASIIDVPSILSACSELGYSSFFQQKNNKDYLTSIFELYVEKENVQKFAIKVKKLQTAKELYYRHEVAKAKLLNVTGTEKFNDILSMSEIPVLDMIDNENSGPKLIGSGLRDRIEYLCNNPVQQIGISSGNPVWDRALGGGLRGGTVNIIGARTGVGKSIYCTNIAKHTAGNLRLPTLYMDTELRKNEQEDRITALFSEVNINLIETGQISKTPFLMTKVFKAIEDIEKIPYYHESIAGLGVESQFSIIKQWLLKVVGINPATGKANPCVIIYDYIKLMDVEDLKSMQEFQALGFLLSDLHNLAMKYDLPIVATIQLNRDGITKESGDVVSGSDRILWLCSNFSIFKEKSDEEIGLDGIENGNKKMVVMKTRHGPGLDHNNYINMFMDGSICKIAEGKTKFELANDKCQS